jgi:hypothetical protein
MSEYASQPSPARPVAVGAHPAATGQSRLLEQVIASTAATGFDAEAFHALEKRDESLIEQEILSGAGSSKFVYQFTIKGTEVSGISVVGARHLAYAYGGIRHRMIASAEKRGALFVYTTYPHDGGSMRVDTSYVHDLADEGDYYMCIVEMTDMKKGNSIQIEKREFRTETTRDGRTYERPHFQGIAQAKAFRNGVLSLVPQDVQLKWKQEQMRLGKNEVVTASVADEKRGGVLRYAASKGLAVNRQALEALTLDQIAGLGEAARADGVAAFQRAALALGVMTAAEPAAPPSEAPAASAPPVDPKSRQPRQPRQAAPEPPPPAREPPPPEDDGYDRETGELLPPGEGAGGQDDQTGLDFK